MACRCAQRPPSCHILSKVDAFQVSHSLLWCYKIEGRFWPRYASATFRTVGIKSSWNKDVKRRADISTQFKFSAHSANEVRIKIFRAMHSGPVSGHRKNLILLQARSASCTVHSPLAFYDPRYLRIRVFTRVFFLSKKSLMQPFWRPFFPHWSIPCIYEFAIYEEFCEKQDPIDRK